MSGISFTAIDFETANSHRGSACAVGLVKVHDGHIVDTASWLIKPPPGIDDFDPINVELHGIAEQDVQNAADWEMSLEGILQFVCEDPLVAFDAAYDASVMRKATDHQHLDLPAKDFYCALRLAQDHLALPRHRLDDVLAALDLPPVERHEPRAHALACAQIVLAIAAARRFSTLAEVWEQPATAVGKRRRGRRVRTDGDPEAETSGAGHAEAEVAPGGRDEPDANLAVVAPDAGPHRTPQLVQLSRAEVAPVEDGDAEPDRTPRRGAPKRAFSTAAGLVLFALGVAAAVGLAYLTGFTIRFFAAGQNVTAALTLAAATATMWAIWASITLGWHRLRPGT
ncbi:exonuclease domain-containing protein [Arthrobacter globiformis]|uniref:exonuclease domain-containing protein n=1 Tax=Arthrobacter globiformis TaxID=1665 RepID=UPI0027844D76|nr:exonuclease domain-containing protein [Arthrobacter globiformis]MDQ0863861.1 DNA polymerase-3 subunit epsilon [Arthrobacter globiformis]